ncbi:hypothetical protein AXF42_Ash018661 [Apostasia shenzhenica]|uniref:Uncharacterized protein n=1 Tax=Apostasia shenzhenica TaxID=1088818 RepID=A0A2I0B1K8_9ASPA|nr:hypothetical protein AXF42_Ash018661 [Apostasia shenzhenica]
MKRARRRHPPATQLGKEAAAEGGGEEVGVPEPVCGGAIVDVVSSPDDTTDDRKTLAELGYTGKGKEPMPAAKPQATSKGSTGVVIGEKKEGDKAVGGQEKENAEGPCLALVPLEVHGEKRDSSGNMESEPPQKKARSAEGRGFAAGEEHDWQRSVEPPYSTNFSGVFGDIGVKLAVRMTGVDRRRTVLTVPAENKGQTYQGEIGLALGSGLMAQDMEEKMEATSTPDLYSGMTNRITTVRISFQAFLPVLTLWC